jgi:YHS domain-containing protein
MKTHPISFLSGFIAAIGVPILVNAAGVSRVQFWNPTASAKDKGIVVLAEETAKSLPKTKINVDKNGVVLKGFDPVAYFTRNQAVKGNPAIQTRYGGATYQFTSVADKAAFDKNPSTYVPQYGGFCSCYVGKGQLRDIDPTLFSVYKGKLYVYSGADAMKEFRVNMDDNPKRRRALEDISLWLAWTP